MSTDGKAFTELLRLAIRFAPDAETAAELQAILDRQGPVTNDTGGDGPPPKQ